MRASYDDTRRHILDAGQQIIASKGFAGVGLSEILANARIPKGSFYHYFDSKEGYGVALLEHYVTHYLQQLDALLGEPGPARDKLLRYFSGWLDMQTGACSAEKCLVVKLSAEVADLSDEMRTVLRRGTDQVIGRLAEAIENGRADGSLPAGETPRQLAQTLYQLWLGASLLTKLRRDASALEGAMSATRRLLGFDTA